MANKGAQALLSSDVSMLREIFVDPYISVSTFDPESVVAHGPLVNKIIPGLVDVPYKKADLRAKRLSYGRDALVFKIDLMVRSLFVPFQGVLALVSCILAQAGLGYFYRTEVVKALKDSDLIVSTSDENFKEGNLNFQFSIVWLIIWWSMLFQRTLEVMVSKGVFHKKVVMFPNSIGPFRTFFGRFLTKMALRNMDFMLLRDKESLAYAKTLGVELPTILTADMAVTFRSDANEFSVKLTRPTIGVAAGAYFSALTQSELENYVNAHARALDYMIEKHDVNIAFLPHDITGFKGDDRDISNSIFTRMHNRSRVKIISVDDVSEYHFLLKQLEMLVSSKMHPAVLATSSRVPAMYVVYDHKQTGFFEHLGFLDNCVSIKDLCYESLVRKIESVWDKRVELSRQLDIRIPMLQKEIKKAVKKVVFEFE
jgi:polysaccharide pyruvyl transferase WcaK-like protein